VAPSIIYTHCHQSPRCVYGALTACDSSQKRTDAVTRSRATPNPNAFRTTTSALEELDLQDNSVFHAPNSSPRPPRCSQSTPRPMKPCHATRDDHPIHDAYMHLQRTSPPVPAMVSTKYSCSTHYSTQGCSGGPIDIELYTCSRCVDSSPFMPGTH
jgi:hypothetical protein